MIIKKDNLIKKLKPLAPALGTGVPLVIFEEIFTNLHYNENIINPELILFSFSLSVLGYGYDRLRDTYEEKIKENPNTNIKLYLEEQSLIIISIFLSYGFVNYELYQVPENFVFAYPLLSCFAYKDLKPYLGLYKPIFIGFMWAFACVLMPCIIHDKSFEVLQDPLCYIPCILGISAVSSIADIKDIEKDREDGVETFAVQYGANYTKITSFLLFALSSILYYYHPNSNM